ncbi:MAG: bifunctional riboflavin kinase/FAD synthetase [Legionella sp.]|nr:bifunctional riboflavin kinase/FAD synthetase [Legionella sp.]
MKLLRSVGGASMPEQGTVATLGNFDGVHRGHQALLHALKAEGRRLNLPTLVILFEPQPLEFFDPERASARLTNFKEKWRQLSHLGIDYVGCLGFNRALACMPAEVFAQKFIFSKFQSQCLLVGEDFRFGHGRKGDVALLQRIAHHEDCDVKIYSDMVLASARVSSTRIRGLLAAGQMGEAAELLGRPYSMYGRVVRGDGMGRTWGVPTANIQLKRLNLPLTGVFCVHVRRENGQVYQGVANIGQRPTIDGVTNRLEVHLFDCDGSLYHEHLEVYFLHKLRGEVKFNSLNALISQIKTDILDAKTILLRLETPNFS